MNIFIIGSGWLALPLAEHLNNRAHQITVTTTSTEKSERVNKLGFKALVYQMGELFPDDMLDADVVVFANTCKDVSAYRSTVKNWPRTFKPQVIYTSTTSVYQDNGQDHDEESPSINPEHPTYLIEQTLKPLKANIIRLSGLVGPGFMRQDLIVNSRHPGRFFRKSLAVRNPKNQVNLVHRDDAIGVIISVIDSQLNKQIINASADNHPTKGEYYSYMAKQLDGTILDTTQETSTSGKTINNLKSKTIYTYQHSDVWQMSF
ncbi:hypothetical protein [Marinicella rhabdoformis]|uniref:hypothetical protein n=1 Tax=Marinicella rhabdoformis TaxID=2580566 RepID=UPI0012AEDFB1|nr:hypothetical protein [Marinicella rhabdoformis]